MTDEDETAGKTPEECRDCGLWEVDPVYYSLSGNNKKERNMGGEKFQEIENDAGDKRQ
uniref:Uracil-DNA glycosylase n=1 Tax=Ascaris lumbricoides TaxID=6252 RepID=A0A0M3HW18_ASCLU